MSRRRVQTGRFEKKDEPIELPSDPIEQLLLRARKLRRRGDERKALVLMRQACNLDEWRARSWTLLGAFLRETGQRDEARRAFERALWLRTRAGDKARATVTLRLALALTPAAA